MSTKTVLVVGGAGFVGSHAVRSLLGDGYEVTVVCLPCKTSTPTPPKITNTIYANVEELSDEEVFGLLEGYEAVVYSAGVDDRASPKCPAGDFFYEHNVEAVRRFVEIAKQAGVKQAVIVSSYFLYFEREWPELRLSERHPYILSRKLQAEKAIEAGGDELDVMIVELPYVFGATPGTVPLWLPLIKYIKKSPFVFFTKGGTNIVSVEIAGQAIANTISYGSHGSRYVVGGENMTWPQMLTGIMEALNIRKKIIVLPTWIVRAGLFFVWLTHKITRRESGLNLLYLADIQTRQTFLETDEVDKILRLEKSDTKKAFSDTIEACKEYL